LPYQVNKKPSRADGRELVHEKKIEGISHIQVDEIRHALVIELKNAVKCQRNSLENSLYKQTQLQDTFRLTW
jgi:DNA gyrase subunit A